jgi:uncharacterized membrane protein
MSIIQEDIQVQGKILTVFSKSWVDYFETFTALALSCCGLLCVSLVNSVNFRFVYSLTTPDPKPRDNFEQHNKMENADVSPQYKCEEAPVTKDLCF